MLNGNESVVNDGVPLVIITDRESALMPVIKYVFSKSYHMLCRRHIDQNVLAKLTKMIKDEVVASRFTMNCAESEHSVLKLWLSTCHGDLDTMFFNIDFVIESQISEIKYSLEFSKFKEKFNVKSNLILKNISNNISHLALRKIWLEIKRAREIIDDPLHKTLEIGIDISFVQAQDMDSEMRDLASLLDQISTGPISKVREVHRIIKDFLSPVFCLKILDDGRRTQSKGISLTGNTCPLHIKR
ncbi:hypothetical protein M9H77_31264 [Catharanthus roseus]|uniref:Uncharacterized protein n=1 Tax=Catharanthus roseus TaxID=4058 RepID=A0ACC0A284_CATRO|nr:hypothetical protein M9H77_31264 [Catharanthus roseus]